MTEKYAAHSEGRAKQAARALTMGRRLRQRGRTDGSKRPVEKPVDRVTEALKGARGE